MPCDRGPVTTVDSTVVELTERQSMVVKPLEFYDLTSSEEDNTDLQVPGYVLVSILLLPRTQMRRSDDEESEVHCQD